MMKGRDGLAKERPYDRKKDLWFCRHLAKSQVLSPYNSIKTDPLPKSDSSRSSHSLHQQPHAEGHFCDDRRDGNKQG